MIKPPAFKVLKQSKLRKEAKPGTIIYGCIEFDYHLAAEDTRRLGKPYGSFTFKEDGGYPFFTMPREDVERIISLHTDP